MQGLSLFIAGDRHRRQPRIGPLASDKTRSDRAVPRSSCRSSAAIPRRPVPRPWRELQPAASAICLVKQRLRSHQPGSRERRPEPAAPPFQGPSIPGGSARWSASGNALEHKKSKPTTPGQPALPLVPARPAAANPRRDRGRQDQPVVLMVEFLRQQCHRHSRRQPPDPPEVQRLLAPDSSLAKTPDGQSQPRRRERPDEQEPPEMQSESPDSPGPRRQAPPSRSRGSPPRLGSRLPIRPGDWPRHTKGAPAPAW